MSSAASATPSSSAAKKVEWYHLDRVAIAKRICLDPAAVKLKTALNNNNNNNNYTKHNNNSKGVKSSGGGGGGGTLSSSHSNSSNTSNSIKTSSPPSSSSYDIVHLLYPPGGHKHSSKESANNNSTSTTSRVVSHSGGDSVGKGIFALRYNANSLNGSGSNSKSVTNYVTSVAGSRQFAALQQKRRRKAQRIAAAAAAATVSAGVQEIKKKQLSPQKKANDCEKQQRSPSFLDEHSLIVNGAKSTSGSCGSSSRSSSSGVSSDFEELDGTTGNSSSGDSSTNMKVATTGSRKSGGHSKACSSSSECEEDDDEGPHPSLSKVTTPSAYATKMCKNANGGGGGGSSGSSSSSTGSSTKNNLSDLDSLMVVDVGSVSASGKGVTTMGKNSRVLDSSSRIVNRKVAHQISNGCGGHSNSKMQDALSKQHHFHHSHNQRHPHQNHHHNNHHHHHHHHHNLGTCTGKAEANGNSTSTKSKHHIMNGTSFSSRSLSSSASSTVSGSTDNDRDTDNSFSEFPADLDFIGVSDKGKRRTDRYDSSESSDSGVATLSPGTSDSPELISNCCDFSSEHLDVVGNLISASRSSSLCTTSSSYPTSKSTSSSSSSSSASTCSGTSTACLAETQGDPQTGSSVSTTSTTIFEATLPSSLKSSTGSEAASSLAVNPPIQETLSLCQWKGCTCSTEATHNILEHIQTTHVAPQMKTAGYVCLWEGCKVFNKRSSSLSWLERHVLSHSGNKPFKCIFPGCGLSFSSQNALERHVNSHIATNGTTNGAQGNSTVANRKIDASPAKGSRRKKMRFRKQRINIGKGQRVDYFDKRVMEVIKHWLSSSVDQYAMNAHDCTFRGEIIARRVIANCERQVLVRWYPRFILNDEWMAESKFTKIKLVPLRRIPSNKIRLLYPALFPPQRQEKASRKRKPRSNFSPFSPRSMSSHSEGSSSLTTIPPSPNLSASDIASLIDTSVSFLNSSINSRNTRSSSSSPSSSASLCSSYSSSASTSSTSSSSSSFNSKNKSKSSTSSPMMIMMDTTSGITKSNIDCEEDKCHKKFCGSSPCDCPSALLGNHDDEDVDDLDEDEDNDSNNLDSSHWALEVLYEDLGIFSS